MFNYRKSACTQGIKRVASSRISPDFEHVYNAIMAELRGYIHGSECHMDKVKEWISTLPPESVNSLLEQLRRNIETWKHIGSITDDQYKRALEKFEEIKNLVK